MDIKELINHKPNKKALFEAKDLKFNKIPVRFAGSGGSNVKMKWNLKGIAKNPEFEVEQTMWVPYNELADDFVEKVKEICKVKETKRTDVEAVDISFFKG